MASNIHSYWNVCPADVIDYLEILPEDHHHCAELAVGTLYMALADCVKELGA
jgi:nitrogen fixation NifU-like protein